MNIKRRQFLERTSLGLLSLGIADKLAVNIPQIKSYYQSLAEPNIRKLALLIGINNYPFFTPLKGCLTDVELQRELLIHWFGFRPEDILILTDEMATKTQIETAFQEHLIKQAKSGDVVVFHFSGYGSQVTLLPDQVTFSPLSKGENNYQLVNSLVPFDSNNRNFANDLLFDTLVYLGRSLLTTKFTMVLDTSFTQSDLLNKGFFSGRTLNLPPAKQINSEEIMLLNSLINNNLEGKKKSNKPSDFPGIIWLSAGENQIAREIELKGTYGGLFTYYLSKYLWEITAGSLIQTTKNKINYHLNKISNNQQSCQLQGNSQSSFFTYYSLPEQTEGAEGIITELGEKNTVKLKLLGLPHNLIQNYGINSRLTILNDSATLQINSQFGLNFQGKVEGKTTNLVGKFVQEWIRMISKNISLIIALDEQLNRIEKVDATSAFSIIDAVSLVVNKGEQPADFIFSKTEDEKYQLLDFNGVLIGNTKGESNEAIKLAVKRLESHLNSLLAAKIWNLTINNNSSRLGVKVTLKTIATEKQTIFQIETKRYSGNSLIANNKSTQINPSLNSLKTGAKIQYILENYSDETLYFLIVGINNNGNSFIIYSPESNLIAPHQTRIFPQDENSLNWLRFSPEGITDTTIIFSKAPFNQTLAVLSQIKQFSGTEEKMIALSEPVKIAQAIIEDLHQASGGGINPDFAALDVNYWATFNFAQSTSKSNLGIAFNTPKPNS